MQKAVDDSEDEIGLVYRYSGEAAEAVADLELLSAIRSEFPDAVYLRVAATSDDPWAARLFRVEGRSGLFVVGSENGSRPLIRFRLESPLAGGAVEAAIESLRE